MKKIVSFFLVFLLVAFTSFAQPVTIGLPGSTVVLHYRLAVGCTTTTVLIFPSPVKQADRGYKDLIAQKQTGVENVLKIKAARTDFAPTNLHVFTADGKIYAFDIYYSTDPLQTTFDLTKMDSAGNINTGLLPVIEFSQKQADQQHIVGVINQMKQAKPFFSASTHKYRMKLQLRTIYLQDDQLAFGFTIANRSNLPYDIDFTRLYIRDKRQAKRSSVQEREMIPLYTDTLTAIPGKTVVTWVVVVPKFTIPDHRKFALEVYEKNGGRYLTLEIKNRQLFKAKSWH